MSTDDLNQSLEPQTPDENTVDAETAVVAEMTTRRRKLAWPKLIGFYVLPSVALGLAVFAGFLKWTEASGQASDAAASESVAVARDVTTAILSYKADTAGTELHAVRERLTGTFLEAYTTLVDDVVIPGAKEKKISALAQVPAVASVSANPNRAVALVFVNQTVTIGSGPPTSSASSVRVTMENVGGRWLVSGFDPV
ncbi:MAG: hypothetical protein ACOYEV_11910 [Candidatus Nanopelagicales bacterium]